MAASVHRLSGNAFEYNPLCSQTSIRLLSVHAQRQNELIRIELWEQAQADPVPYRCLSYTWGDMSATSTIQVNGHLMDVGSNLYAFLVCAAQRFSHETLWIDAICIDQSNDTEKGHQVQRMGDVFKNATEVLVWLGDDETVGQLFDWTREHSTLWHKIQYYLPCERTPKHLRAACRRLVSHSYWTRAWVVQELAFARSIRFLCGSSESSPGLLKRCENGELFKSVPSNALFSPIELVAFIIDDVLVGDPTIKPVLDFLEPMTKANPNNQASSALVHKFDIWELQFEKKLCREPRDRIYSLLSIANATDFEVNYTESNIATFWRAADYFDAWPDPLRLRSLWEALELSGSEFLAVSKTAGGRSLQCSIGTRLSSIRFGLSCHNSLSRAIIRVSSPVAKGDVLLCPRKTDYCRWSSPHFIIRSDVTQCEDSFVIAMFLERRRSTRAICLDDAELWYGLDGKKTKIVGWKELILILEPGDSVDCTGEFILRLPPFYVLSAISLYDSGSSTTTSDVLRNFDSTCKDVEVKMLP
jgi:hypothetical protein